MQLDDLKGEWLGDDSERRPIADAEIARIRARAAELHRAVRRRDRLEIAAALLVLPIFIWLAFRTSFQVSRLGALIVAAASIVIPLRLRAAQRPAPDYSLPLKAMLHAELESAQAQKRLLSSVVWWYAGPIWLGVTLFMIGPLSKWPAVLATAASTVFMGLVAMLNRSAVREQIDPRIAELQALLEE
jgi:hypothetical protein